jgi:hypothetical protein
VNPWLVRLLHALAGAATLEEAQERVAEIVAEHDESVRETLVSIRGKVPLA